MMTVFWSQHPCQHRERACNLHSFCMLAWRSEGWHQLDFLTNAMQFHAMLCMHDAALRHATDEMVASCCSSYTSAEIVLKALHRAHSLTRLLGMKEWALPGLQHWRDPSPALAGIEGINAIEEPRICLRSGRGRALRPRGLGRGVKP